MGLLLHCAGAGGAKPFYRHVKSINKNGTRSKKFRNAGLNNWFWNEQDAIDRLNKLVDSWKDFGFEYKIVKLG